jgi:hypothetical protein
MQNHPTPQQAVPTMAEMALLLNCQVTTLYSIQYKYGLAYLMWYLPCDDANRRRLEGSKIFWQWYKFQWEVQDEALLLHEPFATHSFSRRRKLYKSLHCPRAMAVEVKPNSVVLQELGKKKEVLCSTI